MSKPRFQIKDRRGALRDAELERELNKTRIGKIFLNWQKKFINQNNDSRGKTTQDVVDALNELAAILHREMGDSQEVQTTVEMVIWPAIQRWSEIEAMPVKINGVCVCHTIHTTAVPLKAWLLKNFSLECEKCGHKLPAKECAIHSDKKTDAKKKKGKQ